MPERARLSWSVAGLGLLTSLGAFTNDSFVPSMSLVATGLGADPGTIQLTISAVLGGFLIGALFHGPLAERFGRKPVLCYALACYVIGGFAGALATSIEAVVAVRAVQGLSISAVLVLTRAIILDRWTGDEASKAISWLSVFHFLAPVLAPLLGGYIAGFGIWSAIFWAQGAVGMFALIMIVLLLSRKHSARGGDIFAGVRTYGALLRNRNAVGYMFCSAVAFTGLIVFVSTSSFVFVSYYGLSPQMQGVGFSMAMLATALSSFINGKLVTTYGTASMIGFGSACLGVGGTLVIFACWRNAAPTVLVAAMMIYNLGFGFVYSNTVARAMSHYRHNAASVSSAFAATQFALGLVVTAGLSTVSTPGLMPLGITMAACGLTAALIWWGWLRSAAFT